jgi:tetratricopeptide (TPR) repeat protein
VPAFLLGAAVLAGVAVARPHWHNDRRTAETQLAAARDALDQSPPDAKEAVQRGLRVLALTDTSPHLAGEAHFVVGSARLRLADEPSADAGRERQQARQHLEQAETLGVPESDRPKLQYRLGKVWLLTGGDVAQAVAALEQSVAAADDPAEGYGLLARAYLRLTPPDLAKALEATKQQLAKTLPTSDAKLQAEARFRLGELHLKLNNVKEGRQWLGRVGTDAPLEQFFAARALLAESYEATEEWAQAARNWVQARDDQRLTPAAKGRLLYRLGRCYAQDQRPKEAEAAWAEALGLGGDEAQAAALRLAELKLDADPTAALEPFAAALKAVQGPDDYKNPLVPADEARQLLEKATQLARAKNQWDTAGKVAELYARLALPGHDDAMAAQTADARAAALAEWAKRAAGPVPALEEQAREQVRLAALAYERAAGKAPPGPGQAHWLWLSANRFLQARQLLKAQEVLARVTRLDGVLAPDTLADAWYQLATTYDALKQYASARAAYQHCLTPNSPFALPARHGLAKIDIAEEKYDDAEQALQENLTALLQAAQPDADLQERTLYALAAVAYKRQGAVKQELREYGTAIQRLLGALQQYPNSPQAVVARFMLANCYWNEASFKDLALKSGRSGTKDTLSDDERKVYQRQKEEFLQKAAEQYEAVEEQMLARERAGNRLSAPEASSLNHASFMAADCYFWLQKYEEAVRRFGALALRYQQRPDELIALSRLWQTYVWWNKPDQAKATIDRVREALTHIPDAAFDGSHETHRREYWLDWLNRATRPAAPK